MVDCRPYVITGMLLVFITACTPSGDETSDSSTGTVRIGQSASVRINGQPIARAIDGKQAGAVMLSSDCDGVRQSPDVRINGTPAAILDGDMRDCSVTGSRRVSTNVRIGN